MTGKIFIDTNNMLQQITEDEIRNQQPYRKFIAYINFLIREIRVREIEKQVCEEMLEEEGKKIVEEMREEDDEEEFEREFSRVIDSEDDEEIELTEEEQEDISKLLNIADYIAEEMIEKYFEYKKKRERRNEYYDE